nr:hypothetical protein [uncultured Allomuricauda sp.]
MRNVVLLIYLLGSYHIAAQRQLTTTITLDTEKGSFSEGDKRIVPFDESFKITGVFADKKVSSVELAYRLVGYCTTEPLEIRKENELEICCKKDKDGKKDKDCIKKVKQKYGNILKQEKCNQYSQGKHYFLIDKVKSDGYVHLDKVEVGKNSEFTIIMDALHPNEIYELRFTFYERVEIDKKIQERISKEVVESISATYSYKKKKIRYDDFKSLNDDVWKKIKSGVGKKSLYKSDRLLIDENITSNPELRNIYKDVVSSHNAIRSIYGSGINFEKVGENNVDIEVKNILEPISTMRDQLILAYERLLTQKEYKSKRDELVNRLIDDKLDNESIIKMLRQDLDRWTTITDFSDPQTESNSYLLEILMGRAMISEVPPQKADFFDIDSGKILWSFFVSLKYLKDDKANKFIADDQSMDTLIERLERWIKKVEEEYPKYQKLKDSEKQIPSLYADYFFQKNINTDISTKEILESRESRYLGIDFGVMFAPEIESTFIFEGINFHFRPVNRRAKFSDIKGWDKFLKQFSVFAGVAQRVGNYDDNYENLIGVGSPFLGVGYRFHRAFRINTGALFYELGSNNPAIPNSNTNVTYFLSVSVDVKLKDVIQVIAGTN